MLRRGASFIRNLTKLRSSYAGDESNSLDVVLEHIAADRAVLLLDHIVETEIIQFTQEWISMNSPPGAYARGKAVLDFLILFRARFLLMEFHPDNLDKLWASIRSTDNPSVLQYVVELTTHFRMRAIANDNELQELIDHLSTSFSFIHLSDKRLIDSVVDAEAFSADEQFFDELPTPEEIQNMLVANTWLIALTYCHRFTTKDFEEFAAAVYEQTIAAEKTKAKEPVQPAPTVPRVETKA